MVKVRNIHSDQVNEVSESVANGLPKDSYEVLGTTDDTKTATKATAPKADVKDADSK